MIDVVSITFKDKGKAYFFSPNGLDLSNGEAVIVETDRGMQIGYVIGSIIKIEENRLNSVLKEVIRKASKEDIRVNEKNVEEAYNALQKCRELVEKKTLKMNVIDASYTFDRKQLLFRFVSDNRVDFRDLAKELAGIYRTRIELRQVGVRDKAREVGGIGQCGRCFCCSKFLTDFDSVSINMAKEQNLALNPNKINGACGRLLCCLKYEEECYRECRKDLPHIGKKVKIKEGEGTVVSLSILEGKYTVEVPDKGRFEVKVNDKS